MSLLKLKIRNKVYLAKYESPKPTVTIGGRKYPIVQIGRQWWMAENLDWKWDGLIYGSTSWSDKEPYANYYNNDSDKYGETGLRYGLLYNKPAEQYFVDNLQSTLNGWHVPSVSEWNILFNELGGRSKAGISIKSTTGWSGVNGNGDTQFNAVPSGVRSGAYYDIGEEGAMFTTDVDGTGMPTYVSPDNSNPRINSSTYGKMNQFAIRLVKDAT